MNYGELFTRIFFYVFNYVLATFVGWAAYWDNPEKTWEDMLLLGAVLLILMKVVDIGRAVKADDNILKR